MVDITIDVMKNDTDKNDTVINISKEDVVEKETNPLIAYEASGYCDCNKFKNITCWLMSYIFGIGALVCFFVGILGLVFFFRYWLENLPFRNVGVPNSLGNYFLLERHKRQS